MANHVSLMLDSMFTAVDEGFSYDGIVSAPGAGLEDRPRLTVLLHDTVDIARIARMAVLRGAARVFRGPPEDLAGLAPPLETMVQVPTRVTEGITRVHDAHHTARPNVSPLETDSQDLPTHEDTVTQQAPGATEGDEDRISVQALEAPLDVSLSTRQETVPRRAQLAISYAEDHEVELGVQPNVAPLHTDDHNLPNLPEIARRWAQTVTRPEDEEEELGVQSGVVPSHRKDDDPPIRVRTPLGSDIDTDYDAPPRSRVHSFAVVTTCTIAMAINALNITSVAIALPNIGRAINIREDQLQWLLSAYSLSAGCLLLFFERLGDLYGHRKAFLLGMMWQAGFALGCGFSSNGITLNVFRAFQGIGMAAAIPSALSVVTRWFPPSRARFVALAIFAAGAPIGAGLGTIIGGVLTELSTEHWRYTFFLSAVLSAPCFIGGRTSFYKDRMLRKAGRRVDWIGVVLVTTGLALIVFALGQGPIVGWETHYIIPSLVAGVSLTSSFFFWEHRLQRFLHDSEECRSIWTPPPLITFSLWTRARGRIAVILVIAFLIWCSFMCWLLWVQLYYQHYLQLSPMRTVVRFVPMFVEDLLCNFFMPMLVRRVPLVVLVVSGSLSTGVACMLFALINPSVTYWAFSFPSTLLVVLGVDLVHIAGVMFIAKITEPREQHLLQSMNRIGAAFGLVVSTIAFNSAISQQSAELGITVNAAESNVSNLAQLQGYRAAQWTGAGFSFLAAVLAAIFLPGAGVVGYGIRPMDWWLVLIGRHSRRW